MAGARDTPAITSALCSTDPHVTDPPLLREHSQFKTYDTSRFRYPNLRIFFRQHAKAKELPAPLPMLVCIPGLGGSVAQFHPLLSSLVDFAPCLAIDYPGAGRSDYAISSWDAYSSQALLELLEVVIEDHRDKAADQSVVLIGHSMGTTLAAGLASKSLPHMTSVADHVVGLVAICPLSGPWNESVTAALRRLLWIPGWMFALWRTWDGMGGLESPSVSRFVGQDAEPQLKLLQYRFNQQSRTAVWRRMAYGALPVYVAGKPLGGVPGLDIWASLDIPVYLIGGEKDHLTPPVEIGKIAGALRANTRAPVQTPSKPDQNRTEAGFPLTAPRPRGVSSHYSYSLEADCLDGKKSRNGGVHEDNGLENLSIPFVPDSLDVPGFAAPLPPQPRQPRKVIRSVVMPAPANHALLYMPRSVRALAGHISDFLAAHVTCRLSLAWQLQFLSHEGKWDVKNLDKWKSVTPVSDAIGPSDRPIFRAMKTLREADDVHCPTAFVETWGTVVKDVIDVSKDQPVYDPRGLERGGVHYHKFPTVSKIPPEAHEVEAFISLVDRLRDAQEDRGASEGHEAEQKGVVGVHCHYGFNRTGYFIVCYLVERCGFAVPDAIETFAKGRPNGIRHSHFLDRLYVRYNDREQL